MTPPDPPADPRKARAQRLRSQIDRLQRGEPAAGPPSPREITDKAAREAARRAEDDRD